MQPPHHALMLPLWLFKERWASEGFGTPAMLRKYCKRFGVGLFSEKLQLHWQPSPRGEMLSCSWPEWRTAEVNVLHTDQHAWHIMRFCYTELDILTDHTLQAYQAEWPTMTQHFPFYHVLLLIKLYINGKCSKLHEWILIVSAVWVFSAEVLCISHHIFAFIHAWKKEEIHTKITRFAKS